MIDVVLGIIIRDNKILLIKRVKEEDNLIWSFPGGKKENNEKLEDACIREVYEETSLVVKVIKCFGKRTINNCNLHYYLCSYVDGDIKNINEDEVLDINFFSKSELYSLIKKDNVFLPVRKYIDKYLL